MNHITRLLHASKAVAETRQVYLNKSLEEKRKLYKCKKDYVTLDEIPTWSEYFRTQQVDSKSADVNSLKMEELDLNKDKAEKYLVNEELNSKIGIFTGDITCLELDSIVNAAKKSLLGGGGVDGAIHRAAGKLLLDECETLNGCKTGEAKITAGYNLPAKYVIHTVGPVGYHPDDLANAYLNSLNLAVENKCRTIAFPCISTGVYGYPNDKAAREVSQLLRDYLEKNSDNFDRIILCLFMQKDIIAYGEFLSTYFPIPKKADCQRFETMVEPPKVEQPQEPILVVPATDKNAKTQKKSDTDEL